MLKKCSYRILAIISLIIILCLPGCAMVDSVHERVASALDEYCEMAPDARKQIRDRFTKRSRHMVIVKCAGGF
jgi:hypothetical protein